MYFKRAVKLVGGAGDGPCRIAVGVGVRVVCMYDVYSVYLRVARFHVPTVTGGRKVSDALLPLLRAWNGCPRLRTRQRCSEQRVMAPSGPRLLFVSALARQRMKHT